MAAMNREELMSVSDKEFQKLMKLLADIDETVANAPGPDDDMSIKQVIGHRVHWLDLFFGWYEDGRAGKDVQTPAPGYKWNQLKPYNALVYQKAAENSWSSTLEALNAGHAKLMVFLEAHDDDELYVKHLYPWTNDWTVGRWAEASGPSHYRSAAKHVRKVKKMMAQPS